MNRSENKKILCKFLDTICADGVISADTDETILTKTVTVDDGITKDSDALSDTDTSVTVWLSGGTAGVDYEVACKIVTSASRIDERTIKIQVRER